MAVIAIDLGGTKLATAIFTGAGKPVVKAVQPLGTRTGTAVGGLIRSETARLFEIARSKGLKIRAAGVSVPGICDSRTGTVWVPNIPGWEKYSLVREVRAGLGNGPARVVMDSDRSCYILGEAWQGAAKECKDAVFLAVGTGIGAGVLTGGRVLRGARNIAGSIGWMALDRPFRSEYAGCGCFECHASGAGLARVAREMLGRTKVANHGTPLGENVTAREILSAAERGDALAIAVLNQAIEFWGMAVANVVSLFDPEKVIFGGGVFGPAARHLPAIRAEATKWAQPISMKLVKLAVSRLKGGAGLYGAARLALMS